MIPEMDWEGLGVSTFGKSAKTKYPLLDSHPRDRPTTQSHSLTPHFTADMITLFYILDGQPFQGASPIDICNDNTIGHLRKLIKEERNPILREVGLGHLSLYRVSIPNGDLDALREASCEIEQGKNPMLDPFDVVGEVFPNQPAKQIHVMVKYHSKLPPKTCTVSS